MMKKVLFISQYLNRNGTEAFMMSVFRGVDRTRFQIDFLLYTKQETDYSREVEAAGSKVYRVTSRRESPYKWYKELYTFFKLHSAEYQAIHFCGNHVNAMAPIYFAYHFGVPVRIVHAHNSFARGSFVKLCHVLNRTLSRRMSTHHLACSDLAAKWFFGKHPAQIVKNGIDLERFAFDPKVRSSMRESLGLDQKDVVIGHVGAFRVEKNHRQILRIFHQFLEKEPNARLVLIGDGALLDEARLLAEQLAIVDKVHFLGLRSDVDMLMQAMDLFLMPSTFEGLPFVLIEAQTAGLPCVISDVISKDIALTSLVHYCSLNAPLACWVSAMQKALEEPREDKSDEVKRAGYSVKDTVRCLEAIYGNE